MIRQPVFNLTGAIPLAERQERRLPITPEDVSTLSMVMFSEVIAIESQKDFMMACPPMTHSDVDHDDFHANQLTCKRIKEENEHIHISTFEEEGNPDILRILKARRTLNL